MQRQMFAKGGAAFPDMNNDGDITQADILMGRGVEFKQEGGIAGMMQPPAAEQLDPQAVEQMMMTASQSTGDLEGAQDFEQMMNMVRGDDASMGERREELAGVVGPEDAMQTPESVLALVQPVMQIASVDQGIGELAQQEMQQPMEGPMAGGIMSTMAPPPPPAAPPTAPPMMGGPPPANFKDGGLVRRGDNQPVQMYAPGGEVEEPSALQSVYEKRLPTYMQILGDPSAQLADQKRLTQAQMLFDLANTGLAFAAPMQGERPGLSAAERLAMAAQQSQLFDKIGARAQAQQDRVAAAEQAKQGIRSAALTSSEAELTAERKAEAAAALQSQKDAAALAQIDRKDALSSASAQALELLKQAGRIQIKDIEGAQSMTLEELRQAGAISLEDARQVNRVSLEGVLQQNREAIETLRQSGTQANTILADKLEKENILLRGDIDLAKMGVANTYELEKMEIGQGYATELQNSRLAVQQNIADNELELKTLNSALNQARADKQIALDQEKFALAQQTEARIKSMEEQKLALETRKVDLDELTQRLEVFGSSGKNKAQSILANQALMDKYANGELDATQTTMVNNAIDMLSTRETIVDSEGNTRKTGGAIPENARRAVIARNQLLTGEEGAPDLAMPRDTSRITAGPADFGEAVSLIMEGVPDVTKAFGSDAFGRNVINVVVEAASFGMFDAPFADTDKAISSVNQLNLDTLTHFQQIKELRDSVALMNKLEKQTANPGEFLTGDTKAKNKTNTILNTIDELISVIDLKIGNMSDVEEVNAAKLNKQKALQLRAGFEVIDRAYSTMYPGGDTMTPNRQQAGADILFGAN
jgi:hypothetical protein